MTGVYRAIGSYSEPMMAKDISVGPIYGVVREFQLSGLLAFGTIRIENRGGMDLANLKFQKQVAAGDAWEDWIEGSDFESLARSGSGVISELSRGFSTTLAGGGAGVVQCFTGYVNAIRVLAKVSSGSTAVNVSGTFGGAR